MTTAQLASALNDLADESKDSNGDGLMALFASLPSETLDRVDAFSGYAVIYRNSLCQRLFPFLRSWTNRTQ